MSQLEKLKALQESKSKTANLSLFNNLVVIDVGIKPTQHFPKLKDDLGNKIKDENGKDKRSDVSDGYTYSFIEFTTGKMIKVVLPQEQKIELLGCYVVVGLGYDIKSANMIFIEQKAKIAEYR
ncbi:hypothetical protein [Lactococcus lactis]|uniref:hypothetical protein n=1 Tax=Lactococcus lactis TaxID=1358 RepID=UPI00288DF820|nr:hypothetical protein [Lactococcus lactis]MDT2879649.1 hypothetical protein [Lactococcus lactis]MDT2968829.1 hypothetical protein [Lactococcus lactis]